MGPQRHAGPLSSTDETTKHANLPPHNLRSPTGPKIDFLVTTVSAQALPIVFTAQLRQMVGSPHQLIITFSVVMQVLLNTSKYHPWYHQKYCCLLYTQQGIWYLVPGIIHANIPRLILLVGACGGFMIVTNLISYRVSYGVKHIYYCCCIIRIVD